MVGCGIIAALTQTDDRPPPPSCLQGAADTLPASGIHLQKVTAAHILHVFSSQNRFLCPSTLYSDFFFLLLYIPSLLCFLRPAQAERRGGWRATVGPEGRLTPGCCSLHSRLASFRFTRCDVIGWDSHCGVLNVVSSNCVAAMVLLRPPCPPPFVHGPVSHRNNISHLSVASQPVTRRESR